jgi:hypothetical protein
MWKNSINPLNVWRREERCKEINKMKKKEKTISHWK